MSSSARRVAVAADIWMSPLVSMPVSHTTTRPLPGVGPGVPLLSAIAGMARNADADRIPTVAIVIQAHRRRCVPTGWGETVVSVETDVMDDVYAVLVTVDYPDAVTGGLRRTTDALRAVLERTRGDVTNAVIAARLQAAVESTESR